MKIITKVLANKLLKVTDRIIHPSQSALSLIKGISLAEGFVAAQEYLSDYCKWRKKGVVCKLDFRKAFDNIN